MADGPSGHRVETGGDAGRPRTDASGPAGILAMIAMLLAAAYAGWRFFIGGPEAVQVIASNIVSPTLSITATLMAWAASRRVAGYPSLAPAWRLLTVAFACNAAGDVGWAVREEVLGVEPGVGWPDVPYLLAYPLLLWGLLRFPPRFRRRAEEVRFWLDSSTVLVGAGMLLWYFVLYPTATNTGAEPLARRIALSYLVGDLVLLFGIATTLLRRPPSLARRPLGLLVTGLLLQLGGDLTLAQGSLVEGYVTGSVPDALWVLSYAFLTGAALLQIHELAAPVRRRERVRDLRPLPYLAIAAGYGLLLVVAGRDDSPATLGLILGAVVLTGLVVARQLVALRENQRLARELAERRGEARFRSLVQNSTDVITILDGDGRVAYQSPAAERVLGPDAAHAIGRPFLEWAHPEDAARLVRFIGASHGLQQGATLEWRMRAGDGRWLHLESTATDLRDEPTVAGIVVNTRDVTERKELELKLGQAMKMEAIGRLAGGVAHDFNNLLTVIQGHSSLLLEQLPDVGEHRGDLEEIERAARRAASLTRQLLAFSRKQVLQPRVLDVNAAIREMQRMLRRLVRENIELVVELHEDAGCVLADPTQFEQIVLNLCVNACDAMPGGGRLAIATASGMAPDGAPQLLLTVSDTGSGMDDATLSRIFEPFFTTKPTGEGTGLGLATVYGIVEQSGGTIEVESAPDAGSTFRVRLPRSTERCDVPFTPTRAAPRPGRETVLLVEDEAGVRGLARKTLTRNGYHVVEAVDGEAALALVRGGAGPVELLLTDVIMPRIGGPELAERLRAACPDLRVLYMSGYTDDEAVRHGAIQGRRTGFLHKPFTPAELVARVREALDAGSQGGPD